MLSPLTPPEFEVIFASSEQELRAAQSLRYQVFVQEMGADGVMVDHELGLERDQYDAFSRHLLLMDRARGKQLSEQLVGVYRLLDRQGATQAGQFYSEAEFDLSSLISSGKSILELGRSCLHPNYRGGTAMYHLWSALAAYIAQERIDVLFGSASFSGVDESALAAPLALLMQEHLAPKEIRPSARIPNIGLEQLSDVQFDRRTAMTQIPALIKAYLRLGGCVGQGAYLDQAFNTTDVCLVLNLNDMSDKQRKIYSRKI